MNRFPIAGDLVICNVLRAGVNENRGGWYLPRLPENQRTAVRLLFLVLGATNKLLVPAVRTEGIVELQTDKGTLLVDDRDIKVIDLVNE